MKEYKDFKRKTLSNKKTKKAYKELGPEFTLVEAIIKRRNRLGISQKELAKRMGTKQSSIARLESGSYNPSVNFLKKTARALNARLEIAIK